MTDYDEHLALNRASWDGRASAHAASPGYSMQNFVDDPDFLSEVVRFDRERLGDIRGLRGVHLQCHIGTDTVSLQRLGAQMTGLDFSGASLAQARTFAAAAGAGIGFVESDVYSAVERLGAAEFDLVYTGVGALGWLPDIARWGQTVAGLLKPGGRLFIREGHPVLWALDEPRPDRLLALEYPYFEREEPLIWESDVSYVETAQPLAMARTAEWNHGLGEIVTAVLSAGLQLTGLVEHTSLPWCPYPEQMTDIGGGEWQLTDRAWRLPHSYTLQAIKPV